MQNNYTHLSRKAIENGVGIIDLFFRSVEAEQKTLALEKKNTSAAERDSKALASAGFNTVKKLYGSSLSQADIEELNGAQTASAALALAAEEPVVVALTAETPVELVLAPVVPVQQTSPAAPTQEPLPAATPHISETHTPAPVLPTSEPIATPIPQVPTTPTFTPFFGAPYQAGYGGSGQCTTNCPSQSTSLEVPASASVPSTPTVESAPATTPEPTPAPEPEPKPVPAPAAPAAPTSLACTASLIAGECIVPSTSATITWPDADNVESYDIYRDGAWFANTTATTAPVTLTSGATSTFEVIGLGLIGMRATSSPLSIHSLGVSLRINEIAWSGTAGNPNDQWIEVRNMAGRAIDMSRVVLVSETSGAYLPLAGILAGNDGAYSGYYLIERREQATSVTADLVAAFALLAQTGEELKLVWHDGTATTTIDATPPVATCGGWCAGRAAHAIGTSIQSLPNVWALESMERIGSDGARAASWQHNDAYNLTARDFSNDGINGLIYGTPRLPNSQGWPAQGWYCGALVSGTPEFDTPQGCILLLRFMSPRVDRYVGQFIGTIGSSTLSAMNSAGKVSQYDVTLDGAGMTAGDVAFVAVWENRTNVGGDVQNFQNYFTGAATSGPPHTNYAVFEWRKR